MKVMIVHHDSWLRELFGDALRRAGLDVSESSGAEDCVSQLDAGGADAVVVGLGMPKHNGVEVLHEMQSYPDWQDIPVVVLSAKQQVQYRVEQSVWAAHGVKDFVYLPDVPPHELAMRVKAVLA